MEVTVLSALAANRKQFFELVAAAERQCNCVIDERDLEAAIDADYSDREQLSDDEAHALLMKVARPRPTIAVVHPPQETKHRKA